MDLVVSCSLDGRDLAIVKSLININNIYGTLSLAYVDDAKSCQILIAKDYFDDGSVYYALNRRTGKKTLIEPCLNPQTVRALFETLANDAASMDKLAMRNDLAAPEDLFSIHHFILQQNHSDSNDNLLIKHPELTMVLDFKNHMVISANDLSNEIIELFSHSHISNIQSSYISSTISDNYCQKMCLELFKWKLGMCLTETLFHKDYQNNQYVFKLISWPNFGELPFENEFIRLSSMLWKRSENYQELVEHSGYSTTIVNRFLNAAMMTGNVVVSSSSYQPFKQVVKKQSQFLTGLKKLFRFD